MPLRVVDLFEIGVFGDRLDSLLQRDDLVVACHHDDGAELQALRKMHRANGHSAATRLNVLIEDLESQAGGLNCRASPVELGSRPHEDAHFMTKQTLAIAIGEPSAHCLDLVFSAVEDPDGWRGPVEYRDRPTAFFGVAVHIRQLGSQEPVRLLAYLVRGSIVHPQCAGATADVYA